MVVTLRLPDVPVTLTVHGPTVAELLAVNVSVLYPVVGFGAKDGVTPFGSPETERLTPPVNPYWGDT